jgi:hypothetical protein
MTTPSAAVTLTLAVTPMPARTTPTRNSFRRLIHPPRGPGARQPTPRSQRSDSRMETTR